MNDMTFAVTPAGVRAKIPIFTWRGELLEICTGLPTKGAVFSFISNTTLRAQ